MQSYENQLNKIEEAFNEESPQKSEIIVNINNSGGPVSEEIVFADLENKMQSGNEEHEETNIPKPQTSRRSRKQTGALKEKVHQLAAQLEMERQERQNLANLINSQNELIHEKNAIIEQQESHKSSYYSDALVAKEQAIKNELKRIREEGSIEPDREIELFDALAEIKSSRRINEYDQIHGRRYNQNQYDQQAYYPPQNQYPPQYYQQQQSPQQNFNYDEGTQTFNDWFEENQWANPNSYDYSPQLTSELQKFASKLDKKLEKNGDVDLIGSGEYYDIIDEHINRIVNSPQSQSRGRINSESPVAREGSTMADQYRASQGNRQMSILSEKDITWARNLKAAAPSHYFNGMSDTQALKSYEHFKRDALSSQNNTNASQGISFTI